ncbi:glycoside hydrolase family 73 protein [Lactobacillus rodentium]|uniref:N-acetylmuramidase n=1 Tax=Lactobacillus rodentium TaxID=947835 RepID=A0A2Z6TF12_9LACO|nr:glycoside hydrolase family 73 protein [Lactobacillus rodentium]MCR1894470.1 glycoside hydrolase family 73 protein [Lactobacillus rodentium]GBG04820.1 N-acetylmuramidase [Lactobacillus rodentium]
MTKKSRKKKSNFLLLKVFGICFVILILFAGLFYRKNRIVKHTGEEVSRSEFISVVGPIAQAQDKPYGLFPSVTIAQACLESDFGQSTLAQKYNNLFGVKGSNPTTSKILTTQEFVNGQWKTIHGRFQVYDSYEAAIHAHTMLIVNGTNWNKQQYAHVLAAKNYQEQAKALQTDGYATDPTYATKLINLINQYNLTQYDN